MKQTQTQTYKIAPQFYSTPANLTTIASGVTLRCGKLFSIPYDLCDWFSKINKRELTLMNNVFACNVFEFYLIDSLEKVTDFGPINCSELENTFGALMLSEFQPIYFKFMHKIIYQNQYFCKIPITIHFYEWMFNNGIIHKFLQCKTALDLENMLLMLSGDVESNPGPTDYKTACKQDYKRNKYAQWKQRSKEEMKAEKYIRKIDEMERKNAQMQIFGLLPTAFSAVPALSAMYLGNKTRTTMNKAQLMMDKVDNKIDNIALLLTQNLQSSKGLLDSIKEKLNIAFDVYAFVKDLIFTFIHLYIATPGTRLRVLCVEVARLVSSYLIKINAEEVISYIKGYLFAEEKKEVEMQIDFPNVEKYLSPQNLMLFLFAMLSLLFTSVLPSKTSTENLIKRLGELGRSAKGIKDLNDTIQPMFGTVLQQVGLDLHIFDTEEVTRMTQDAEKWFKDVQDLLERDEVNKKSDSLFNDVQTILAIESLYKQGMEISRQITDKRIPYAKTLGFQLHMKHISDLMKLVDTSGAFGTRPRTQPVVIWLYGESGVGKSGMSWPLAVDLNNCIVTDVQEAKDFSKHIYMRNVEQEFWDNYHGQNVVVYDDFGQLKDSQSNPNTEFIEIIRTANIAPYPLHMAHLEDKRKTRFTSKVVLLTSNIFEHSVTSLTFPDAFRRRIDLCGRVKNLDEFTKAGYSASTGKSVQRLDKKKVQEEFGEIISTKVYSIDLVDPESGALLEEDLTYDQFLEKAISKTQETLDSSRRMNEFLVNYAEKNFDKRKVQMQINCDMLRELTREEILVIQECAYTFSNLPFKLYNLDGAEINIGEVGMDFMNRSLIMCDSEEYQDAVNQIGFSEEEYIKFIYDNYRIKTNLIVHKLRQFSNITVQCLKDWSSKTIEFIEKHPFKIIVSILCSAFAIFSMFKIWNYIFKQPKRDEKWEHFSFEKVHITGEAVGVTHDFTDFTMRDFRNFLGDFNLGNIDTFIIRKPHLQLISELNRRVKKDVYLLVRETAQVGGKKIEANVSADNVTKAQQNLKVIEINSSGDNTTLAKSAKMLEANVSADNVTLTKTPKMIEVAVSADNITKGNKANIIVESNEVDMQMWRDESAQNLIASKIFSNLYKIKLIKDNDEIPLINGLFVKGHVMLTPGHLRFFIQDGDKLVLENVFGVKHQFIWNSKNVYEICTLAGEKEAILFTVPNYIQCHADIVKHFPDAITMNKYKHAKICLPTIRPHKQLNKLFMTILGNTTCEARDKPLILEDKSKGEYILREGLEYELNTIAGDCGAPVILNETPLLRKIAGIHVAGAKNGEAFAESITMKDLTRTLEKIPVELQISLDYSYINSNVEFPMNVEVDVRDVYEYPNGEFNYCGECVDIVASPTKTALRPSLLYGKLEEVKTRPSALFASEFNIKYKNLEKCAGNIPYIEQELIDDACFYVKEKWLDNVNLELARVLTYEEAISGRADVSEYMGPIHRQSSPGYPWIKSRKSNYPGKTGWFGNDEVYLYDAEVKNVVEHRINQAKLGIRTPTLWTDTLKDERRPHEKVLAYKTRVFSNGPMDFNIAFRMYYLGFIAHLMENRIDNEVSIGTNVYSRDWTKTAHKLMEKGEKVIAGDFSGFDGSLHTAMMLKFVEIANEFYDDGEENALVRLVLMLEIINSVHICDRSVYQMTHSQPSGNPATTPLNCLINSLGLRMCFSYLAKKYNKPYTLKDFEKYVSIVSYGDDNVINFADEVAEWYNMETLTMAFKVFGFTYTDELKGKNGEVPKWRKLDQVAYLKRKFRKREDFPIYDAPLDIETIMEMPNWCRETVDVFEGTKINAETAIMELHMHDKEIFNVKSNLIKRQFALVSGKRLETHPYDMYFKERMIKYFM